MSLKPQQMFKSPRENVLDKYRLISAQTPAILLGLYLDDIAYHKFP